MMTFQFPRVRDVVEAPDGVTCEIRSGLGACGRPVATLCSASQPDTRSATTVATCDAHAPVAPDEEFSDELTSLSGAGLITQTSNDGVTANEVSERGRELVAVGATQLEAVATRPTKPGHRQPAR